jgi:hypothetical protein
MSVFSSWEDVIVEVLESMAIEFQEVKDISKFRAVRKTTSNPLVVKLMSGQPQFVVLKDDKTVGKLNSLYEAARRRKKKFSLQKGELDGVIGYLCSFSDDEKDTG